MSDSNRDRIATMPPNVLAVLPNRHLLVIRVEQFLASFHPQPHHFNLLVASRAKWSGARSGYGLDIIESRIAVGM